MSYVARAGSALLLASCALGSCTSADAPLTAGTAALTTVAADLLADGRVERNKPDEGFATDTRLAVDGRPLVTSFVLFEVAGTTGPIDTATLRLWVRNPSSDAPTLYPAATDWDEVTLTWRNRPGRIGPALSDVGSAPSASWIEYDVTSAVAGDGLFAFELHSFSKDGVTFDSREGSHPPVLEVVAAADPDPEQDPDPDPEPEPEPEPQPSTDVPVALVPAAGVSGVQRINLAIPLPAGLLSAPVARVRTGSSELASVRRSLARHPDGSVRSLHVQFDADVSALAEVTVELGAASQSTDLSFAPVSSTLQSGDGTIGPRVWTLLDPVWLSASGVVGPQVAAAQVSGDLAAWDELCDYARYDTTEFLDQSGTRGAWLYDRVTTNYRGYVRRGELTPLVSAYREAHIYRDGISGTGASTRIGVPDAAGDLKYHYTQGMAVHYLLTGDERFRESAEDVAVRIADLWSSPGYAGGSDFWTERHAGFALLGYVWAAMVSDDRADQMTALADEAANAYLDVQQSYPPGYDDTDARCFAHTAAAHGEGYGTWGCSPWMSAILAEALDAYAGWRGGAEASSARQAIVKLGRILALQGLDSGGKPYYWLGVANEPDEVDPYDEHWGEPAYVAAMAWHHGGRTESALRNAALALVAGLAAHGSAPHIRSFNWQCRAAPAAAYYLE